MLSTEEQTVLIEQLLEVTKCPVCFNILQPTVVQCESGHGICKDCILQLSECPICTKGFMPFKNRLLEEILELLPHECKYGCKVFVKVGSEHEKWCGFKSTTCKLCPWVGFGKDLFLHVDSDHKGTPLLTENNERCIYPKSKIKDMFHPMSVYGHFFWVNGHICRKENLFKITLNLVPNGVLVEDLEVSLVLENNYSKYMVSTYLTKDSLMNPGDEVNCLSLHTSTLDHFMDQEKKVKYQLSTVERKH